MKEGEARTGRGLSLASEREELPHGLHEGRAPVRAADQQVDQIALLTLDFFHHPPQVHRADRPAVDLEDDVAFAEDLLRRAGLVTVPGSAFGARGAGWLRLSFGNQSPARLAAAGDRLEALG